MSDYLHLKSAPKRVALKDLRWIPLSNYIYCVFFELVSKATDIYCCKYVFNSESVYAQSPVVGIFIVMLMESTIVVNSF